MVIVHGQQIGLASGKPALRGAPLALGAMSIAAGVVGDLRLLAGLAPQHMAAERSAATLLNGRHDFELAQAQMTAFAVSPGWSVGAEDVRDLQSGALHERALGGFDRLQRTNDLAQNLGGYMGIQRSSLELLVSEQHLYHTDVHLLLE